jgi:lipid II:glycine glycyltransferase (peptidoglycan interpeptide bridge formation enzyme)
VLEFNIQTKMSDYKIEVLTLVDKTTDNKDKWEDFVKTSPQGTLFNTFAWSDVLFSSFGLNSELVAVQKNNSIEAGILLFYKNKFGLKVITRAPLTLYNGILFKRVDNLVKSQKVTDSHDKITEIILKYISNEFKFVNFSSSYNINDTRAFIWSKWQVQPQHTYTININNINSVFDNFSSSLRRKIRGCEQEPFVVTKTNDIDRLLILQEESYSKNGLKPILSLSLFRKFLSKLMEQELVDIFSISKENNIHSMRALLKWNNSVYDFIAGTSEKYKRENSTHYLVWQLLQKYSELGFTVFDFMGANTKNIVDFKRSFGGELREYYDLKYYSSKTVKILFKANDFRKQLLRKQN